jgi:Family of unknown function (DUF6789)
MRRLINEKVVLSLVALAAAGVSPNVFPAAQAGLAKMSVLATTLLIPSIVLLAVVFAIAVFRGHPRLVNRLLAGAAAGIVATVALEVVRIASFRLGGMPGDLPRLMGVLLTDRFMLGPSLGSDLLGYAYHFWNGASFGVIFAVLFGRRTILWVAGFGTVIGLGFLASPAVKAMGVGFMAVQMPSMIVTVVIAHLAYGLVLGALLRRWLPDDGWLLSPPAQREAIG